MDVLQTFVYALVGVVVAYMEERFGSFQNASPGVKQVVNGLLALAMPGLVAFVAGWWKPEFGSAEAVWTQLTYLIVPVAVWLVTQVAHQVDRGLQLAGTWLKENSY